MSTPNVDPGAQALVNEIRTQLERQPWYAKFSNTVTTAVGAVLTLIWLATTAGLEIPSDITKWVTAAIVALTVLGVLKTPNGVTKEQVAQLQEAAVYVGEHRRED